MPLMKKIITIAAGMLFAAAALCSAQENFGRSTVVSPQVGADSVVFRFNGPYATVVKLFPSWMGFGKSVDMAKDNKGMWTVKLPNPTSDLYTYYFTVDGARTLDPANILVQRDGSTYTNAVLIGGGDADLYKEADKRGDMHLQWYWSATDGMERRMYVYTPYGYDKGKNYPVLYLLHGGGGDEDAWSTLGCTRQILDNLIQQGKAKPMIVVMPNGNPGQYAAQTLKLEEKKIERKFTNNFHNYQSLVADIVPFIESHYKVSRKRADRAVAGLSMGGGQSFFVAFDDVDKFASVGIFSTGLFGGNIGMGKFDAEKEMPGMLSNPQKFNRMQLFYVSCGEQDPRLAGTNEVVDTFRKHGYDVIYETYTGDHEWRVWRRSLSSFVQKLFK